MSVITANSVLIPAALYAEIKAAAARSTKKTIAVCKDTLKKKADPCLIPCFNQKTDPGKTQIKSQAAT